MEEPVKLKLCPEKFLSFTFIATLIFIYGGWNSWTRENAWIHPLFKHPLRSAGYIMGLRPPSADRHKTSACGCRWMRSCCTPRSSTWRFRSSGAARPESAESICSYLLARMKGRAPGGMWTVRWGRWRPSPPYQRDLRASCKHTNTRVMTALLVCLSDGLQVKL